MPFHKSSRLIAAAFVAGLIAMPAAALAQSEQTPAAAEDQAELVQPTDEQLESFAEATILIVRIQEETQARMRSAVEGAGLTLEQYNEIARAAQANPELDQMLQTIIRERLGG